MTSYSTIYPQEKATCMNLDKWINDVMKRVAVLEEKCKEKDNKIAVLEATVNELTEKCNAPTQTTVNDIASWSTVASKNIKKSKEQIAVLNAVAIEESNKKRIEKNIIIFGVPESKKSVQAEILADDTDAVNEILSIIDKKEIKPVHIKRIRSKKSPGPIIIELSDAKDKLPILTAAKKLRSIEEYKSIYINPDLTDAERKLDFDLRTQRNKLNEEIKGKNEQFRYGIRNNAVVKVKINYNRPPNDPDPPTSH